MVENEPDVKLKGKDSVLARTRNYVDLAWEYGQGK
jgi:hypothetical protein